MLENKTLVPRYQAVNSGLSARTIDRIVSAMGPDNLFLLLLYLESCNSSSQWRPFFGDSCFICYCLVK